MDNSLIYLSLVTGLYVSRIEAITFCKCDCSLWKSSCNTVKEKLELKTCLPTKQSQGGSWQEFGCRIWNQHTWKPLFTTFMCRQLWYISSVFNNCPLMYMRRQLQKRRIPARHAGTCTRFTVTDLSVGVVAGFVDSGLESELNVWFQPIF